MTNYVYLGYGITNENGVAKLDHDANGDPVNHSYVGTGSGEIDVIASLDNPIVDGSLVSQPSSVMDCVFYDKATDGTGEKNTNCYNNSSSYLSVTPSSDGTVLQCLSDTGWGQYFFNQQNNSSKPNPIGTAIECDVVSISENFALQLNGNSQYGYTMTSTGHYKITVDSTNIKVYKKVDGSYTELDSKTTSTYISDYFQIKFSYRGTTQSIKYANMMIYPI